MNRKGSTSWCRKEHEIPKQNIETVDWFKNWLLGDISFFFFFTIIYLELIICLVEFS